MSISDDRIELRAGVLLGEMKRDGYMPPDAVAVAVTIIAYIVEAHSHDRAAALDAAVAALRARTVL